METNTINFILFIIGVSFFFFSQIFLLIQGIINLKFYKNEDRKVIVERTLFEQFSEEVYKSINTPFTNYSFDNSCNFDNQLKMSLNLDTFYDCKDIYSSDLKEECRNNIVANYTKCSPGSNNEGYIFNNKYDFLNYEQRFLTDERIKYCQYFSRYNQQITKIDNSYICKKGSPKTYEKLLSDSLPLKDINGIENNCKNGMQKCGILDTKNNILCLDSCPENDVKITSQDNPIMYQLYSNFKYEQNKKIISSIILSENQPMSHEWDNYIRDKYEKMDEKELKKRKNLSPKDFGLFWNEFDDTYKKLNIKISVDEIQKDNYIINFVSSKYNTNQNLSIYYRNYIGFKNSEELNKFKENFNEKDPRDNPLYKLSSSNHNPIVTITFSCILLVLDILSLIFSIILWKKENNEYNSYLLILFFIIDIIYTIVGIIIIIIHFVKYPKIYIDMDDRMKSVLDLYNKRTFLSQLHRIISIVLSFVSLIIISINFRKSENQENQEILNNE